MGRRYGLGGPWILRGVGLELPERSLIRVQGANGGGKSTLLRLVAGIDAPTEGRITGRTPRTAYVPERFPAALPFTAAGYLVHLGRVHGLRTGEAEVRAAGWLARFGAEEHARIPLAELSKGTGQKVALAQAFLADPDLLVLDEAWTGLDTAARDELDRAVLERVGAGATVVFVDHDPDRLSGAVDAVYGIDARTLAAVPGFAPAAPQPPGPRVSVEATGPAGTAPPGGLPGAPAVEARPGGGGAVLLTVAAAHSDALLRALLTARPPWHIHQVSPVAAGAPAPAGTDARTSPADAVASPVDHRPSTRTSAPWPDARSAGPGRPDRRTTAMASLLRYQSALLLRSQRWLAPVLLYAAFLAVGVRSGQPVLDSLGYAAAALLPVGAWFAGLCAAQEPPAARSVTAAVVGQPRAHLCALLAALGCALVLGTAATVVVLLISEPVSTDGTAGIPLLSAGPAGLTAMACCALMGVAVGALCTRPLVRGRGRSVAATVFGVLLVWVTSGSPANYAVTAMVSGSLSGSVRVPVLPLAGAVAIAAVVAGLACRLTSVRE